MKWCIIIFFIFCLILSTCHHQEIYHYLEEGERVNVLLEDGTDEEKNKAIQENPQMIAYSGIYLGLVEVPLYGYTVNDILNEEKITIAVKKNKQSVKVTLALNISRSKVWLESRDEDIEGMKSIVLKAIEDLFTQYYENPFEVEVTVVDKHNKVIA